jgi:hypothetical protein
MDDPGSYDDRPTSKSKRAKFSNRDFLERGKLWCYSVPFGSLAPDSSLIYSMISFVYISFYGWDRRASWIWKNGSSIQKMKYF